MLRAYDEATGRLSEPVRIPDAGWIDIDDPGEEDTRLVRELGIPDEFVRHALDKHELPRTVRRGDATLVVVRFSSRAARGAGMPYVCAPLGLVLLGRRVVTIGRGATELLTAAARRRPPESAYHPFVLAVFAEVAQRFLEHLEEIDGRVSSLEESLQRSLDNREVMDLLHLQRSLVVFATSLEMNEAAIARVREELLGDVSEHDEILDDALTELRQARHVAKTASNLLSEMMDAFASIISNNLGVVVKLLSAMALVLFIPTIVASFYGMNLVLPLARHPAAFWIVVAASTAAAVAVAAWLRSRRWL